MGDSLLFISHASEDKEIFVRPLAEELKRLGVKVWYDEYSLLPGDSLRESIDKGLSKANFGVVVFSESFFKKKWAKDELEGLFAKESIDGRNRIIPVWHEITLSTITSLSPMVANRLAIKSSIGVDAVAIQVKNTLKAKEMEFNTVEMLFDSLGGGRVSMVAHSNAPGPGEVLTKEKIEELSKRFEKIVKDVLDE